MKSVERVERGQRPSLRSATGEHHRQRHQRKHHHLGDQEDAEYLGGQVDVEVGQDRVDGERDDGEDDPRDVDVEERLEQVVAEEGEDADQRCLEHHVGHRRQEAGGQTDHPTQAVRHVAVERPRCGDVLAHCRVAHGEERQHHRRDDE